MRCTTSRKESHKDERGVDEQFHTAWLRGPSVKTLRFQGLHHRNKKMASRVIRSSFDLGTLERSI